jgi:hypothetical protein
MTKKTAVTTKQSLYNTAQATARLDSLLPSRMVGKLTERQQDLITYDKVINSNKSSFQPGSSITRADLITMFSIANVNPNVNAKGTYKKLQGDSLRLVTAQRKINDVLNHSGLHIRSRGYGAEFKVCEKKQTKQTLVLHSARVERLEARQSILEANVYDKVKVKKNHGKINRVFRANGTVATVLPVRANPVTLGSTANAINRVTFI